MTTPTRRGTNQSLGAAVAEAEERYAAANPSSRSLYERARANLPGGNTRTTVYFSPFPLYMAGGAGGTLTDVDGHRYLDFVNEYTAGLFGHSQSGVRRAVTAAMEGGINLGAPTEGEVKLSAAIRKRFPAMELLRFCNSGTEANLLALATARAATGRTPVLVFNGAYHGSLFYFSHGASPLNMPIPSSSRPSTIPRRRAATSHATPTSSPPSSSNRCRAERARCRHARVSVGAARGDPASRHLPRVRRGDDLAAASERASGQARHPPGSRDARQVPGRRPHLRRVRRRGAHHGAVRPRKAPPLPARGHLQKQRARNDGGCAGDGRGPDGRGDHRMNALGDGIRHRLNALAAQHDLPVTTTGEGSIFGIHFHAGAIRNIEDLDAGEHGREDKITALKKLFHLDLLEAGLYIARRGMGNLSLATSAMDADRLVQAVDEFMTNRAGVVREAMA